MRLTQVLLSLMLMSFLLEAQILAQKKCREQKIQNGRMLLRDKGSKAIYKCKKGFNLVGQTTSECLETRWTPAPPACIAADTTGEALTITTISTTPRTKKSSTRMDIKCTPNEIANGTVVYVKKRKVTFKCNEGYKMFGKDTVKCRPKGTWKGTLPRCVSAGFMSTTAFTTTTTPSATSSPPAAEKTTKEALNITTMSTNPTTQKSATATRTDIKCTPKEITNGKVVSVKKKRVTFECNEGYKMKGTKVVICQPKGTWKQKLPSCVSAGLMSTTAFTTTTTPSATSSPPAAEKTTKEALNITTMSTNPTTQKSATATRTDIKCTPKEITNGKVVSVKKKRVTFECNEGYKMKGTKVVICQPKGTWKQKLPSCVSAGLMSTTAFTTTTTPSATSSPPGEKSDCPKLNIANGRTEQKKPLKKQIFWCNPGFKMVVTTDALPKRTAMPSNVSDTKGTTDLKIVSIKVSSGGSPPMDSSTTSSMSSLADVTKTGTSPKTSPKTTPSKPPTTTTTFTKPRTTVLAGTLTTQKTTGRIPEITSAPSSPFTSGVKHAKVTLGKGTVAISPATFTMPRTTVLAGTLMTQKTTGRIPEITSAPSSPFTSGVKHAKVTLGKGTVAISPATFTMPRTTVLAGTLMTQKTTGHIPEITSAPSSPFTSGVKHAKVTLGKETVAISPSVLSTAMQFESDSSENRSSAPMSRLNTTPTKAEPVEQTNDSIPPASTSEISKEVETSKQTTSASEGSASPSVTPITSTKEMAASTIAVHSVMTSSPRLGVPTSPLFRKHGDTSEPQGSTIYTTISHVMTDHTTTATHRDGNTISTTETNVVIPSTTGDNVTRTVPRNKPHPGISDKEPTMGSPNNEDGISFGSTSTVFPDSKPILVDSLKDTSTARVMPEVVVMTVGFVVGVIVIGVVAWLWERNRRKTAEAVGKDEEMGMQPVDDATAVSGDDTTAVSGDDTTAVSGGDTTAVSGGETTAVSGGENTAVSGGDTTAVSGDDTTAVSGDDTTAVSGDDTTAVSVDDTTAVSGRDTTAVSGDDTTAVSRGDTTAVTGDDTTAVSGDDATAVTGDDTTAVTGGDTTAVSGDDTK